MQKIVTFLTFNNQAEAAVNLYTSAFKKSKILSIRRYGDAGPGPTGSVMTAEFEIEGQRFMATILGKLLGDKDAAKAGRVMQAMLGMKKIDTAKVKEARRPTTSR